MPDHITITLPEGVSAEHGVLSGPEQAIRSLAGSINRSLVREKTGPKPHLAPCPKCGAELSVRQRRRHAKECRGSEGEK
jgi:hypothetical protein